ncbi:MAG: glycosyltransferase family 1 protein [Campylobacterota bacterium]|nr:glycosyltransferase family 1 protein [Campylobacterota bacterium]
MKLLFDARVLTHKNYTGVENYTKFILENLLKKIDINVVKFKTNNKYLAHLYNHFILPFYNGKILFCPSNSAPFFVPKNKKLILTIHDVAFLIYPKNFSKLFQWYYRYLIPFNIKRSDKIITISESSKKEIIRLFPNAKDKIIVIFLGIDKKYKVLPTVVKKKQILYVGSINERKNLIGVIDAFDNLPIDLGYNLVIVGNFFELFSLSEIMKEKLQKAKKNKNIVFKEGLDDKSLIYEYNISEIFIFPSFYEGFGFPPLESMACGTPVITSNISSMPEICGDSALYINPYDIKDITDKMEILIRNKDLQISLIHKGLHRVKQFSWNKVAEEHIKIIKGLE